MDNFPNQVLINIKAQTVAERDRVIFDGELLKAALNLLEVPYSKWGFVPNVECPMVYNTMRESLNRGWMSINSFYNLQYYLRKYYNVAITSEGE